MIYLFYFLSPAIFLALVFPLAIQYQNGWRWVYPLAIVTLMVDVIANYTCLAVLTLDWPMRGEHTFSQRLSRLRFDFGWRGKLVAPIIKYLNWVHPNHIK